MLRMLSIPVFRHVRPHTWWCPHHMSYMWYVWPQVAQQINGKQLTAKPVHTMELVRTKVRTYVHYTCWHSVTLAFQPSALYSCNMRTSRFSMLLPLTNILDWINNLNGKVAPTLTVTLKLLKQCRMVSFGFQSDHECPYELPFLQYLDCALTLYASAHTKNGTNFQNFCSSCQSSSSAVLG